MSYELREFRPGDEQGILACFNRVFRPADGAVAAPRTLADWEWAFARNPAGRRIWLAVQNGTVCAQSAGWPLRTRVEGRETCFTLSVDSMVHPDHGTGLKNPGLFVRTVNAYDDAYGGAQDMVHFGWPNRSSMRIGRAFLHYDVVREQLLLAREVERGAVAGATRLPGGVERLERFDPRVAELWERCAREHGAGTVRDATYFEWRFTARPGHRYEILAARASGGAPIGQAVCRLADWPRPGLYWIVDWLVPADELGLGELLLAAAGARARACGAVAIAAFFPEWSPWSERFARAGFKSFRDDCFLTVRSYDPVRDARWLQDNWWVQPAEHDQV